MINISGFDDIKLYPPLDIDCSDIPKPLSDLLHESNGIMEIMENPVTKENMDIGWLIYPYEMIIEETHFFSNEYPVEGCVFSDNGCGDPIYIKSDGKIYLFECIAGEEFFEADSFDEYLKRIHLSLP